MNKLHFHYNIIIKYILIKIKFYLYFFMRPIRTT